MTNFAIEDLENNTARLMFAYQTDRLAVDDDNGASYRGRPRDVIEGKGVLSMRVRELGFGKNAELATAGGVRECCTMGCNKNLRNDRCFVADLSFLSYLYSVPFW